MLHPTDEIRGRYMETLIRQLEAEIERVEQRDDMDKPACSGKRYARMGVMQIKKPAASLTKLRFPAIW